MNKFDHNNFRPNKDLTFYYRPSDFRLIAIQSKKIDFLGSRTFKENPKYQIIMCGPFWAIFPSFDLIAENLKAERKNMAEN